MKIYPELCIDGYKLSHRAGYPVGTQATLSTWTPRGSKIAGITEVVAAGNQMAIQYLFVELWGKEFFSQPLDVVVERYTNYLKSYLFQETPEIAHIVALHKLGYLPIEVKALDEGTVVPLRTPVLTITNTNPDFFWLPTYLETQLSSMLWPIATAATIAHESRKNVDYFNMKTMGTTDFAPWQSHNFSARGMEGPFGASMADIGHLFSFFGTDTVSGLMAIEQYYRTSVKGNLIGGSVNALEHSTQMAGIEVMLEKGAANKLEAELEYIKYLITEVYPTGIVSIVMDTYDYYGVISNLHKIKDAIMSRDGKLVCRPDSSPKTPLEIICGDPSSTDPLQKKGSLDILWDQFGGTMSANGYKVLDSHIGIIYGDSITLKLQKEILQLMMDNGYAAVNVVFGIGSFTYQYQTRDTFGFALKEVGITYEGKFIPTSKDPKTDNGTKKSQRGAVAVYEVDGVIAWTDGLTPDEANAFNGNMLKTRFKDGKLYNEVTLQDVRTALAGARTKWLLTQGIK